MAVPPGPVDFKLKPPFHNVVLSKQLTLAFESQKINMFLPLVTRSIQFNSSWCYKTFLGGIPENLDFTLS